MDYARRIGKPEERKAWTKNLVTIVSTRDECIQQDQKHSEDRRLVNWKKWLANRKTQYEHIESSTGRHQIDQTINSCEKVRPLVEMRTLMDYANVPVPVIPDKYRGGPEFWRTPEELFSRGDSCLPKVTVTPSKKELNIAPELTYVDLPKLIEKEKGLTGLKSKKPLWKRSQYLKKRRSELCKEIELLVPKEPKTKNLVIEGFTVRYQRRKKLERRIPPITISDTEEGKEDEDQGYPDRTIVLKIQEREIIWRRDAFEDKETETDPITWELTFASGINRLTEKEIIFENKGNHVIVYQWRDATFQSKVIPLKKQISPFYFNKSKEVILPGQFVKLKVWYRPRVSGVFSELWRLLTEPELCPSLLIFRFWGCAETVDANADKYSPAMMVDRYLDRCIRDTRVREIVSEMIDIDTIKPPEPLYGSLFLESEIFTIKNPLCFYHPSILQELHKLYYTATNQTKQRWDLSLNELRETLLNIMQPERRHNLLLQFSQLYKECLKPILQTLIPYEKHRMVYNLLCSSLNQFEAESFSAKSACFATKFKASSGTVSEMDVIKSMSVSQMSVKSSNSRGKRGRKSATRMQSAQVQETVRNSSFIADDRPYKEIFFIRIYKLLEKLVERVSATIDSFNNLNERDK